MPIISGVWPTDASEVEISIIISASHQPGHTRACIESLERTVRRVRWETLLAESDANAAAKMARAPMLCFLHGDTVLMPGWLEPMRRPPRRDPWLACIGNVQREPYSGLIDHAGIAFNAQGLPIHAGRDEAVPPRPEFARWPAVSAACFLIPKDVFLQLGGFDPKLGGDFQAADFCLRAASAGYHHLVANRSIIYHRGEDKTAGAALFEERWGRRIRAYWELRAAAHDGEPVFEGAWRAQWEAARETRRQQRQDIRDAAADGRRYLRKHLARPWRYNFGRVCQALVRAAHPLPAAIPPPPHLIAPSAGQTASSEDHLFDPPRQ